MRIKTMTIAAITAVLTLTALTPASADFFPAQEGNYWIFSYTSGSGGWGMGSTDSGTIRWDITKVDVLESYPVQYRIHIQQTTRLLQRRVSNGGMIPNSGSYDSLYTYNPPQYSKDSLVLRGLGGVNGLWFEGDTCWSFVHDTSSTLVGGKVALVPDTVSLGSRQIMAVQVDPTPCRDGGVSSGLSCGGPKYFTCADGIGPVAYTMRSSPCLMDAGWSESWTLIASNRLGITGGPCLYDKYPGTARITRISPVSPDTMNTQYEVFFSFSGPGPQNADLARENNFSQVVDAETIIPQLHLKPGHVYPCTLSTIVFGTCSPGPMFTFGVPQSWTGYDTSSIWIEPSSVMENAPSTIHLLGDVSLDMRIDWKSVGYADTGLTLTYRYSLITNDTLRLPGPYLRGTSFSVDPLSAGTYPVYRMRYLNCPVCGVLYLEPRLIDTLLVTPGSVVTRPVAAKSRDACLTLFRTVSGITIRLPATLSGPITVTIHDARGALLGSVTNVGSVGHVTVDARAPGAWFVTVREGNRIIARQRITDLAR